MFDWLKVADADGAVGIEAEDFIEGIDHCRSGRDDRAADDGHLALVNVAAPDGKSAIDDGGDAEHKAEHHDYGQTVADAGFEIGGTKARPLSQGGQRVEGKQGRDGEERTQPRTDFWSDFRNQYFFHIIVVIFFPTGSSAGHGVIFSRFRKRLVRKSHRMKNAFGHHGGT